MLEALEAVGLHHGVDLAGGGVEEVGGREGVALHGVDGLEDAVAAAQATDP